MQVFHTAGVPPSIGNSSLPIIGWTRNSSVALTNSGKANNGSGGNSVSTRRTFLKSAGAAAAGLIAQSTTTRAAADESLALRGGQPAVSYPRRQHNEASRWPIYAAEDEQAVLDVLRNPSYGPI